MDRQDEWHRTTDAIPIRSPMTTMKEKEEQTEPQHPYSSPSPSPSPSPVELQEQQRGNQTDAAQTQAQTETTATVSATATATSVTHSHRPRLVRKPSPLITYLLPSSHTNRKEWSWTQTLLLQGQREAEEAATATSAGAGPAVDVAMTDCEDGSNRDGMDLSSPEALCPSSLPVTIHSSATIPPVDSSSAIPPAVHRRPSLFDDEAMEIDFDAIDVDAIVAQATRNKTESDGNNDPKTAATHNSNVIDLTMGSQISTGASACFTAASASPVAPVAPAVVDIEDLYLSRATVAPLSLRPSPPLFFVTDFSAMNWCEQQVDLALRLGKRKPPPSAQAVMDAGTAIHLAYELETVEKINIAIETHEDVWALRLLNMMMGIQELGLTGRTRELPVFGYIRIDHASTSTSASPSSHISEQPYVWVMGIIDEVVRLDLFQSEMQRKSSERDALKASKSPRRKSTAPVPATVSEPFKNRSQSISVTAAEKRKRQDEEEFDCLFDDASTPTLKRPVSTPTTMSSIQPHSASSSHAAVATSIKQATSPSARPLVPSAVAPSNQPAEVIHLSCCVNADGSITIQIGPFSSFPLSLSSSSVSPLLNVSHSQQSSASSLIDMDISDDDIWQLLSVDSEKEWRIERQMSQEAKERDDIAQHPPLPSIPLASTVPSVPPLARSSSLPPIPPPAPPPRIPISPHYVVMDHKTRATNSMPAVAQKIGTYLQVSIYKLLLDRWLGRGQEEQKVDDADEEKKSSMSDVSPTHPPLPPFLDDPDEPPFPLSSFFSSFRLSSSRPLSEPLRLHMQACGLAPDLTLGDLLIFTLASFKAMRRTYKEMKVEYEYQKDKRVRRLYNTRGD